jgi:hypothetical protein
MGEWLAKRDAAGCIYGEPWYRYLEHWSRHASRCSAPALRSLLRLPWRYALDLCERWMADPTSLRLCPGDAPLWSWIPRFWDIAAEFGQRCEAYLRVALPTEAAARQEVLAWFHITSLVLGGDAGFLHGAQDRAKAVLFADGGRYLAEGFGTVGILRMFEMSLNTVFLAALDKPLTAAQLPLLRSLALLYGETLPITTLLGHDSETEALLRLFRFAGTIVPAGSPEAGWWRELAGIVLVQDRHGQEARGFYRPPALRE